MDIGAQRLPAKAGIEKGPGQNGPDVHKILAEQSKAGHQPHLQLGGAVKGLVGEIEQAQGDGGDQGGVAQGGPRPGHGDVVGDEGVLGVHDGA